MFGVSENLTSVDLTNFDMNNVKDCSYMFFRCNKLESIVCQRGIFGSPTDLSQMFDNCNNLTSIPGGLFWYNVD
ncbi:MAG: BspA family leucine-rich repeat surface protein [Alphaproteobacteria bacterium]|nr:BspA family leucine-rich repeat surface protein [Alphaproteobacteria bacterium]